MRIIRPLFAVILAGMTTQALADPAPVEVEGGTVQGVSQGAVDIWLGIPFAAPPVGDLRWRAPQPVESWRRTLKADTYGPSCMQPDVEFVSEDCLTLNVFRPASAEGPLPVMVWIHGGVFIRGGSRLYPMQAVAAQGVVGVSINYRLGRLGFFAHPAVREEGEVIGNYGFLDQRAALQWVQRNIAAFGGDPDKVTIFGESAGGYSVVTHVASPMSEGLFSGAITQSGGGGRASILKLATVEEAEKIALDYARLLGIEGADAAAARKLRAIPAMTLIAGASGEEALAALSAGVNLPGVSLPLVDGKYLPDTPEAIFKAGRQHNKVPMIVGANSRDLGLVVADSKDALFAQFGALAEAARQAYDPEGDETLEELVVQVAADNTMIEPNRNLADMAAASGAPTWNYRFSYVPTVQREKMPGTLHGMEIPYTLNVPQAIIGAANTTDEDIEMGKAASAYWVNFARNGNPNGDLLPEWPQHQAGSIELLNFTNDGVKWMEDPRAATVEVWKNYFDGP